MSRKVGLIWAQDIDGIIGNEGQLPWTLPEDLKHFADVTKGSAVIMGRKTWDSLPESSRPLKGRLNMVLTRQPDWAAEGAHPASSLDEALEAAGDYERVWVIGGGSVYQQALSVARRAVVTKVYTEAAGNVFAPQLGDEWVRTDTSGLLTSRTGLLYRHFQFDKIFTVK
jgi:dihydrofolate reductase